MGRLSKIEQIVNKTINHYSHVKIFPRGLPRFADSLLRGNIRFSKRTGNNIALINPDNTFPFQEPPQTRDNKIILSRATNWIVEDCILSLGPERELHKVHDVIDSTILLKDAINQTFTMQDKVLLHSYPLVNSIAAPVGTKNLIVKSHYQIANGDTIAYLQTESLLQSLTEIKVVKAIKLGTTTDLFFTLLYLIELEKPVQRVLESNSTIYIRAYPAYFSAPIRVPNALFTSEPIGPFLVDILSGRLLEGAAYNETISIRTINRTGGYVVGTATEYQTINKNYLLLNRSIPAHVPMFWDLAEGTMRLTPNKIMFKVDNKRKLFCVGTKCVPHFITPMSWRLNLVSNEDCSIRFIFHPNDPIEFNLVAGIPQNVIVSIVPGSEITDIEINATSDAETCEIQASDWTPIGDTVEQIEYSLVAEVIGTATYQASGLIIKPYFLGSEFLKTTYDIDTNYDSGKIYL